MSGHYGLARLRRAAMLGTAALALAGSLGLGATAAQAQTTAAEKTASFDIPAGPVSGALRAYADATGVQLIYNAELDTAGGSPGVRGTMSAQDALARLLAGTDLSFRFVNGNTVTIENRSAAGADGELVTGVVSVEGYQGSPYFGGAGVAAGVNGINGSRDITATEGTGSFTSGALTIGSKVPQAMKDVPQSISVLTSERMEQQNVTDFTSAMRQLPGVTLVQGATSLESTFYSRGFKITGIQIDGGAPLSTNYGFYPQIDMSIYDHVELLRGAAGQFGAYGDPGGTVNLVRKKPLNHAQFSAETQAGSWSNYRIVADASSQLGLEGRLRGRLVMTFQDNHYFYKTAKDNKTLIYGVTEFDVNPTTLVTVGINYTRQDSVPWYAGLPRYQTGTDIGLPRSTSFAFPWNRWDFDTTEIFGGIEQKISKDWTLKLDLTYNRQSSTKKVGAASGSINPTTLNGSAIVGDYSDYRSKQFAAETTLIGAFDLFGQRQEVTIGANRSHTDGGGYTGYDTLISTSRFNPYQPYPGGPIFCTDYGSLPACPMGSVASSPPIDVFDFDPSDPLYTEPRNPLPTFYYPDYGQTQMGAYVNLRLTAFDRLHLTTGLRWSRYENDQVYDYLCANTSGSCDGMQIGDIYYSGASHYAGDDISWPPPVSLSFDVTKSLTAYAGYTDIYQSQAYSLDHDRNPLPPITGSNWEGGLKWAANDGKFNLSVAAYKIKKKGFGVFDQNLPYEDLGNGVACCYFTDPDAFQESKGIDFEATGEIVPGWQVAASYTYSENKQEDGGALNGPNGNGRPFVTIQPKNLYKLWMSYDFGIAGHEGTLSGLTISGGFNGQSSAYYSGTVCVNFAGTPDPVTGLQDCASYGPPDYIPYDFTVPARIVFSARIDYRLSSNWSLAVNLENILDKTYYQGTNQYPDNGNWYGAPRSFTATLRAKW